MLRTTLFTLVVLLASLARAAEVTFVSPLPGSQAIGPQLLEVRTDIANINRVDFSVDGVLVGVARTPPYRVAFDFGTSLAARTIVAKVWSDAYARTATASVTTAALTANESIDVDLVEVPVRVRSSRSLRASDFRLTENGVVQTIRDVKRERPPAHFAFVVDRSMSMNDGKLDAALRAIENELAQLRSGDTASLVLFNQNVARAQPITAGQKLDREIVPSGGTSLRDALATTASDARTYAIVITDGGDRNSAFSEETALRAISGTRTVVNALVLGRSQGRFLERAAANTGGVVIATNRDSLRSELARVLQDINSRYLVVYQSQGTKRGWRQVDLRAKTRGVEVVTARKGYFAR